MADLCLENFIQQTLLEFYSFRGPCQGESNFRSLLPFAKVDKKEGPLRGCLDFLEKEDIPWVSFTFGEVYTGGKNRIDETVFVAGNWS